MATTSSSARAVIVSRLSLVKTADLSFGAVLPSAAAGTVTVSPTGARSTTGGVTAAGSAVSAAQFAGYGYNGGLLLISVNATAPVLTRTGGTQTMTYDTFVISSTPTVTLSTAGQLFMLGSTSGMFQFGVGATLRVKANQAAGRYAGSFAVTVIYQ
ncbi:MAG: DUF4402 domain-containing protein [Novosphingobium sp.]